ncbi:putative ras-related protein rab-18 [Amanita rubescens]|nr:putative ras-related protein rab-18 [Amanita rubescens]
MQRQQKVDFKLLVIGDSSVGKTSLLLRSSDSRWVLENGTRPTTVVDYRWHKMQVNGKNVLLRIWDTGGQERFRTITPSFYREAHSVILVYDVTSRETFDMIERWYTEIEKNTTAPVVKMLVGNKVDKVSSREVSTLEGKVYARVTDSLFAEASAKTGVGVTEMLRVLVKKMLETHKLKVRRPRSQTIKLDQEQQSRSDSNTKKGSCC